MINRDELLEKHLEELRTINASTQVALDILKKNSETIGLLTEEILFGEDSRYTHLPFYDENSHVIEEEGDNMDSLVEKIIKQVKWAPNDEDEEKVIAIDVSFDSDKFDPQELMRLVNDKLRKDKREDLIETVKEEYYDEFEFDNPLE